MFVCICAGLTEEDLKKAVADGYNTLTKLMYETGCSMCLSDVERIVIEANKCGYQ
jgi:bacterioferritin-associated ferredoxin